MDGLSEEMVSNLVSAGFVVDGNVDEVEKYLYFYDATRFATSAGILSIAFLPTYDCNLACPYCLQGQDKKAQRITPEGVDRILVFARKEIGKMKDQGIVPKAIRVFLYGGEPLLEKERIRQFCKGIKCLSDDAGIPAEFSMTSNFTLLDDDFIDFIEEFHIVTQVSIDGTPQQHDVRRIMRGGQGTYDRILANLEKMRARNLQDLVVIRLNIDRTNIDDAEAIISAVEKYSNDVYFGFLDHFEGNNDCYSECIDRASYSYEISSRLDRILHSHGFHSNVRFGKQAPCSINSINKYFIDYRCDVYKCEMLVNMPEMRAGYIDKNGDFISEAGYFHQMAISPVKYPECRKCLLLPMCAGGCAGKSYFKYSK